jgi:hypothetical protein
MADTSGHAPPARSLSLARLDREGMWIQCDAELLGTVLQVFADGIAWHSFPQQHLQYFFEACPAIPPFRNSPQGISISPEGEASQWVVDVEGVGLCSRPGSDRLAPCGIAWH